MPAWGLTAEQRKSEEPDGPWGLHPRLLQPAKVTTDPVHGDIHTTWLEQAVVDSPPFQRLRRVRQLGTTHLVYPGATHSRFSHSLGALRFVQDLLDAVLTQHEGSHPVEDLVDQWRREGQAGHHVARAVVVARLGALLHDISHLPFGHSMEDDVKVLVAHDANIGRFKTLWAQLSGSVRARAIDKFGAGSAELSSLDVLLDEDGALYRELLPMIVSKTRDRSHVQQYPWAADLVGDTICADLMDYLLRDHLNAGLPIALGRRFISAFFIVPDGRGIFARRAALNLVRDGHERTDVATELLKALRYRYELSERALVHHAKLSADAMLGQALESWSNALWLDEVAPRVMELPNAVELLRVGDIAHLRRAFDERFAREMIPDPEVPGPPIHRATLAVRQSIEETMLGHGDDGFLEHLASYKDAERQDRRAHVGGIAGRRVAKLLGATGELADAVLERRLFKLAGRVDIKDAPARELYARFGEDKRELSNAARDAERYAGLRGPPQVVIWLPSPRMREKIADVLVDDGGHIDRFAAYEEPRSRRGQEIYANHGRLWALWVFTHPAMERGTRDVVLARLAEIFGVAWEGLRDEWGRDYWHWTDRLILSRALQQPERNDRIDALIEDPAVVKAGGTRRRHGSFATRERNVLSTEPVRRALRELTVEDDA